MASTRNNNTPGNYCLQQRSYKLSEKYTQYVNSQYGTAYRPAIPCVGYTPSHMPRNTLSNNPVDIESALFGINSTNLVSPAIPTVPQLKKVKEIEFFDQIPLIMPKDLVINNNQRPFPIPD